jgi:hypothetical protein
MIVKTGRLYLWKNDISTKELILKVGTGSSDNEYVEIDQTELESPVDATITVATEALYNQAVWSPSITDITDFMFDDERKIIIYAKISAIEAFELGEIGLFVKNYNYDWDSGVDISTVQQSEPEVGNIWFNENDDKLYTYSGTEWDSGVDISTVQQSEPEVDDVWFNEDDDKLYTYIFTNNSYVMISRNLLHKQYVSNTESKIIKYTINI